MHILRIYLSGFTSREAAPFFHPGHAGVLEKH